MIANRRNLLFGLAALPSAALLPAPAKAAQFVYKFGHAQTVENPVHVRAVEMAARILRETGGRLEIQIFPNSSLGADQSMILQVRSGAVQFSTQAGAIIAEVAPSLGVESMPFAFKSTENVLNLQTPDPASPEDSMDVVCTATPYGAGNGER